jgi:hypothetical protein
MTSRLKALAFATLLVPGPWAVACTSSSSSNDAGSGGSSNDAGSGVSAFCTSMQAYESTCTAPSACQQAVVSECATIYGRYSSAAIAALQPCLEQQHDCGEGGDPNVDMCMFRASAPQPTAAQQTFAQDYCSKCATALGGVLGVCTYGGFDYTGADLLPPLTGSLYVYDDATIQAIKSACMPGADAGATECANALSCIIQQVVDRVPAACVSTGGGQVDAA